MLALSGPEQAHVNGVVLMRTRRGQMGEEMVVCLVERYSFIVWESGFALEKKEEGKITPLLVKWRHIKQNWEDDRCGILKSTQQSMLIDKEGV